MMVLIMAGTFAWVLIVMMGIQVNGISDRLKEIEKILKQK